jgi:hypothetical protein
MRVPLRLTFRHVLLVALALGAVEITRADDDGSPLRAPFPDAYRQECGACHVPYPPHLLPTASWQRIMQGLAQHFGADASLEPAVAEVLTAWLTSASAGNRRTASAPPEDRITRSRWFLHEHDEIPAAVFQRPAIGTAANCAACHAGADEGVFDEHGIRIPR